MRLTGKSRYVAALITLIGVLFTQLAVAAYVCPATQIANALEAAAIAHGATDRQSMDNCGDAPTGQPALCKAQTQVGSQSLDKPQLPDVSPFLAVVLVASLIHENHEVPFISSQITGHLLTRTTAPPIAIQNCCFRI